MNEHVVKKSVGMTIVVGLVMLILGGFIGVAGAKYLGRSGSSVQVATTANTSATKPDISSPTLTPNWNPFEEMHNLQARMDRMFQQSFDRFRASPKMDVFKDDSGYSLSLNVRDLKNHYEVQALLPDTKASDAKVTLKGNRLEVGVTDKASQKPAGGMAASEWGRYDETIQLAGNVNSSGMKVQRKGHELLITIPKV